MENLKAKLFNAILALFDESFTEYKGLDDELFIEKVCRSVGMTEAEYKNLMFGGINHENQNGKTNGRTVD